MRIRASKHLLWQIVIAAIYNQFVTGVRQALFASLSQLQMLWHNDIHMVKLMEKLLEDPISDYKPFKRYVKYIDRLHYQYKHLYVCI